MLVFDRILSGCSLRILAEILIQLCPWKLSIQSRSYSSPVAQLEVLRRTYTIEATWERLIRLILNGRVPLVCFSLHFEVQGFKFVLCIGVFLFHRSCVISISSYLAQHKKTCFWYNLRRLVLVCELIQFCSYGPRSSTTAAFLFERVFFASYSMVCNQTWRSI